MQTGSEVVKVDFIIVDAYSPYTAIIARPWLHTLGAVSSTLHQKVKYRPRVRLKKYWENNSLERQCMVTAIRHKPEAEPLARKEKGL